MAKIRVYEVEKSERYEMIGAFLDSVVSLKEKKDVVDFFVGLLTPSEMLMIARRIRIAQRLLEGGKHDEIRDELGVGFATITNAERWLRRGSEDRQKRLRTCILGSVKKQQKKVENTRKISSDPLDKYAYHRAAKEILKSIFGE